MPYVYLTVCRGDEEIDLQISAASYSPAVRARTWGPPDAWSPSEPAEVEIGEIRLDPPLGAGELWTGELTDAEEEDARERLLEAMAEDAADERDCRGDYEYDLERDEAWS